MNRTYINGVRNVQSNGVTISFVLEDAQQSKSDGLQKSDIIHVITEIDAAEGIFRFLLDEIEKIKGLDKQISNRFLNDHSQRPQQDNLNEYTNSKKPPLGKKLNVLKSDHTD